MEVQGIFLITTVDAGELYPIKGQSELLAVDKGFVEAFGDGVYPD